MCQPLRQVRARHLCTIHPLAATPKGRLSSTSDGHRSVGTGGAWPRARRHQGGAWLTAQESATQTRPPVPSTPLPTSRLCGRGAPAAPLPSTLPTVPPCLSPGSVSKHTYMCMHAYACTHVPLSFPILFIFPLCCSPTVYHLLLAILSVQLSGVKYIDHVVQPSPPPISRALCIL